MKRIYEIHMEVGKYYNVVFTTSNEIQAMNLLRDMVRTLDAEQSDDTKLWLEFKAEEDEEEKEDF